MNPLESDNKLPVVSYKNQWCLTKNRERKKNYASSKKLLTSIKQWSNTRINVSQKRNVMKFRQVLFTLRKWPTSTAEPLIHLVCCAIS